MQYEQNLEQQDFGITPNERFAEDHKLFVEFYSVPTEDVLESIKAKRKIFVDTDFVRIMVPGDRTNIIRRVADETDKQRFPTQYARYKAGEANQTVGTPIELLPGVSPSRAEEYKHIGIKTIEMLANANDSVGSSFLGFQADKAKAKSYLALAEGNEISAVDERLTKENEELKARLERLEQAAKKAPK